MGVQLSATKAKTKKVSDHFAQSTVNPLNAKEREAVDRYTTITKELEKFSEKIKEAEGLKKQLASIAADPERYPETQPVTLRGDVGVVDFGTPANTREIADKNGLIGLLKEKLGYDELLKLVKIGLGDVDAYLSENEAKPFLKFGKGARALKSVRFHD